MAYGALMRQAWQLVWSHKFLIMIAASPSVLVLVATGINMITGILGSFLMIAGAVLIQGCLIMGTLQVLDTGQSTARAAWDAAWPKKWRVAGIEFLAGIPSGIIGWLFGGLMGVAWVGAFFVADFYNNPSSFLLAALTIEGVLFVLLIIVSIVIGVPTYVFSTGAVISCMDDDTPVFESLQRAWNALKVNLQPVAMLTLIQIAISLGLGLVLTVPRLVLFVSVIGWPLDWFITGCLSAWWTAVWAIAWRGWLAGSTTKPLAVRN